MKILLVYSQYDVRTMDKPLLTPEQMNFGVSYLSSVLRAEGHVTRLVVLGSDFGQENLPWMRSHVEEFQPGVIGYTAISTQFSFIKKVAAFIGEQFPHIHQIAGGPHISLNPAEGCDGPFHELCVGEGEAAMRELCAALAAGVAPAGIANLWLRRDGEWERNPTRPFLQDLDSLPFPDRDMWTPWIHETPHARPSVLLGRGCPFHCAYCSNHALQRLAEGRYVRVRSPENIVAEIAAVSAAAPQKREMFLEVETIGIDLEWVEALCARLRDFNAGRPLPVTFGTNFRVMPGGAGTAVLEALAKSNFTSVTIGLESGSERIRTQVLRRNYSNDDVIDAVRRARALGLNVVLNNIIGLPEETPEDFQQTVAVNRACRPDGYFLYLFYPYPGTEIHRQLEEKGLLQSNRLDTPYERIRAVLDLPSYPRRRLMRDYLWFDYDVFRGHKPLLKILLTVMRTRLRLSPAFVKWHRRLTMNNPLLERLKARLSRGVDS
jgi:anaerobic magnesium-protoporphyrin IX monomethyl ester cyclase